MINSRSFVIGSELLLLGRIGKITRHTFLSACRRRNTSHSSGIPFDHLLSFAGWKEVTKEHYGAVADASVDKGFERGWLPEVLRSEAVDIREFHNLDTNHGGATFRYPANL